MTKITLASQLIPAFVHNDALWSLSLARLDPSSENQG